MSILMLQVILWGHFAAHIKDCFSHPSRSNMPSPMAPLPLTSLFTIHKPTQLHPITGLHINYDNIGKQFATDFFQLESQCCFSAFIAVPWQLSRESSRRSASKWKLRTTETKSVMCHQFYHMVINLIRPLFPSWSCNLLEKTSQSKKHNKREYWI